MLTKKMEKALNGQIALESAACFVYLAMASWCETQSLEGCAQFMYRQSEEENMHMMKLFHYVNEMDGHALAPVVEKVPTSYPSIQKMFQEVYAHEQKVTASINNLVDLATKEKDNATYNFLQWYVEEQREEEANIRGIMDRIKLIGDGPQSLYYIDKEINAANQRALAEEGAE